jgi:proteasome lid subunit RPN8/RPN11
MEEKIELSKKLLDKFIIDVKQKYPLKSFGFFTTDENSRNQPSDYIILNDNIRNEIKSQFEDYGAYYIRNIDAGFLASKEEIFRIHKKLSYEKKRIIGVFHSHQRHPAIFSTVDIDFHPADSLWHLIISLRNIEYPQIKIFRIKNQVVSEIVFHIKNNADSEEIII